MSRSIMAMASFFKMWKAFSIRCGISFVDDFYFEFFFVGFIFLVFLGRYVKCISSGVDLHCFVFSRNRCSLMM